MSAGTLDSSNLSQSLLVSSWIQFSLCLLILVARIYAAWRIVYRIEADLYLAVLAFISATISHVFLIFGVHWGLGRRLLVFDLTTFEQINKWSLLVQVIMLISSSFSKMAVVAFLQRMHGPHDRNRVIFLWTVAGSNTIVNLIAMSLLLTQCTPTAKAWDTTMPGNCDSISRAQDFGYLQGSWSAVTDFILALYPITFFWELQLKRSVKISLCVLMGLGILPGVCAICKTIKLQMLEAVEAGSLQDIPIPVANVILWATIEMWVVLIVACIPPIRPLFLLILGKVSSSIRTISGGRTGQESKIELRSFSEPHYVGEVVLNDRDPPSP